MHLYPLLLAVLTATPDVERLIVENDYLAATVEPSSRTTIRSLVDKKTGRELLAAVAVAPLFRFQFSDGAVDGRIKSGHAAQAQQVRVAPWSRGADRGARITFTGFEGRPIQFACTLFTRPGERQLRCGLDVDLPAGVSLESVDYPLLRLRLPLAPGQPETLVTGSAKGGLQRPSTWKPEQTASATQPGALAAAFGCYYDAAGGLYTAAHDGHGFRKALNFRRVADALELSWRHPCFAQKRFALAYDLVLTSFASPERDRPADWRDAADLYKTWATKQTWCKRTLADRDDAPAWLKQGPAMVRFTRAWLAEPEQIERWFRDYWRPAFPAGTPLIVAYWGWEKVGKWVGPEYFPAYPSDAQFRQLVQSARALGGHTFLWPSGYHYSLNYGRRPDGSYLWDCRPQFDALARPHAAKNRDGSDMVRDCVWLRGGQHGVMCPGDPWTIDWLNQTAVDCARHGAEIVQIDQVVGGNFPPCYSRTHGHAPGPGPWSTAAFRRQLQTMVRACRAVEPDTVVGFEEPIEWYMQEIGIQDYRDCDLLWRGQQPASVFSYLYHEYMPTLFQSNRAQSGHDPLALAWCLIQGQIPHLAPRIGLGPGPMIVDGGFERASDEGSVEFPRTMLYPGDRWCGGETQIDRTQRHSGQASLKLFNLVPNDAAMAAQNYEITEQFRPGRTYRLSVWIRSQGVVAPNGLVLKAFSPGLQALETWQLPYPAHQPQWTRAQLDFALPEGTTLLRVMLRLEGPGAVWLDDLKLEEVLSDGALAEVQRPEFPIDHRFMRQWIELQHGPGRPYLALGRMLHPPRLQTAPERQLGPMTFPPVLHNAFEAPDGSQAVVLVNWTAAPQRCELTWRRRSHAIELSPGEIRLVR